MQDVRDRREAGQKGLKRGKTIRPDSFESLGSWFQEWQKGLGDVRHKGLKRGKTIRPGSFESWLLVPGMAERIGGCKT